MKDQPSCLPAISRRHFTAGLAAVTLLRGAGAGAKSCAEEMPAWATALQTELGQMAHELTARLQAWKGPDHVLSPEQFGYLAGPAPATRAIQAAIDAAAHQGGGTVLLAHGDYVSGTLELRSNTRLQVAKGARLLGSLQLADYPPRVAAHPTIMDSNTGVTQSLIFAEGCSNISLCGEGIIDGRGTVLLAQGDYVSGTLELRSNTRLQVAKGARLLGSLQLADYPPRVAAHPTIMDSNTGVTQSLIFAEGCSNISLCGEGIIDGRGTKQNFPGLESNGQMPGRPFLIRVLDCKGVHVQGITLRDSACWLQNYLNCEDLLIEGITVDNQANVNNDGLDIDGCRRVIVRNCLINSEDDAMCFKGASQRPTEQVLIENCHFYSTCNAIKFGTDSEGDFRRVLVRNVEAGGPSAQMRAIRRRRAESAISWEVVDGGVVEDVLVSHVNIVRADSPLFLRLGDRGRTRPGQPHPAPGKLRRIVYDQVTGSDNGARGSYFIGIPDKPIEDVVIRDLRLTVGAAHTPVPDEQAIPELRGEYPDAHMIGDLSPAYGLWARHLTRLSLIRVSFLPDSPDPRPMIQADASAGCEP